MVNGLLMTVHATSTRSQRRRKLRASIFLTREEKSISQNLFPEGSLVEENHSRNNMCLRILRHAFNTCHLSLVDTVGPLPGWTTDENITAFSLGRVY